MQPDAYSMPCGNVGHKLVQSCISMVCPREGLATRASAQQDSEQGGAGPPVLSRVCVECFSCMHPRHGADLVCGWSIGAVCAMLEVGVTSDDDVVRPDVKYPPPEVAMVSGVCTTETGKQTIHAGKGGGAFGG